METASVVSSRSSNIGGKGRPVLSINDDPHTLTTFGNPFAEDEKEDTSFAYVTSLFSKVKNTFAVPSTTTGTLTSTTGGAGSTSSGSPAATAEQSTVASPNPSRKGSTGTTKSVVSFASASRQDKGKGKSFAIRSSNPAPPLVSLTPVISEQPSFPGDNLSDAGSARGGPSPLPYHHPQGSQGGDAAEGPGYGHYIPGFQLNDDTRSVKTVASGRKSASASQVIRRLRGEGQIFCSRCASNIIKASRFGAEGMLRVCNLCLQKLEEESDEEDDRRSVLSVSTNFPAHQLDLMHHHASPYSTLHGGLPRSAETGHLYSIGEMRRKSSFDAFDSASRPSSPAYAEGSQEPNWEESTASHVVHPPFRRGLAEDERVPANPLEAFISASPSSAVRPTLIASPVTVPTGLPAHPGQSSIAFPGSPGSSEGGHSPAPLRSRFNSYATEYDPTTGFGRNRVHSRIDLSGDLGEPGWRTRRESSAYAAELNAASMQHLRTMLRQMLAKERVPHQGEWEETLMKLALKVATHLKLSPRGFAMDARWYVKIKKLPGGAPRDSEYVDGAVITKNVAHKQMSRHLRQPRIMLVTFPFDYSRVEGQLMSIGPILAQEKEYLKNLTARVAAHHPHVLLVEGPVSRLALEYLLEKKIAVARSVKPKAIQFVSRITQSDIISSMDRLALEPKMGDCARFRLQTFEHALIPGRRNTFMRFEGCSRETGCTIILRGGDVDTLNKVKKIASFIVFIVRNLKMETYLWKDHVLTLPPLTTEAAPDPFRPRVLSTSSMFTLSGLQPSNSNISLQAPKSAPFATPTPSRLSGLSRSINTEDEDEESQDEEALQRRLSQKIQAAINPYLSTFISASATLRFPPPYPIRRMKELDDALDRAKKEWQEAEAVMLIKEEEAHRQKAELEARAASALDILLMAPGSNDITPMVDIGTPSHEPSVLPGNAMEGLPPTGGASALLKSAIVDASDHDDTPMAVKTPVSIFSDSGSGSYFDQRRSLTSESSLISSVLSSQKASEKQFSPLEPLELKEVACIAQDSQLAALRFEQQEMQRIWEWYLRKNKDDFVVEHYQKITVLTTTVPTVDLELRPPCTPPRLEYLTFYGENDLTVGQVVEEACRNAMENRPCSLKSCKVPSIGHSRVYIHNENRVLVSTQPWPAGTESKIVFNNPMDIVTFSFCCICGKNSPYIPMTEEARRYSFAKLLELHFYPADVRLLRGAGCFHNIYLHHVRYFAINNGMAMRMQTDPVDVFEIVFPPMRTRVRPEELLGLKNKDFAEMDKRNEEYWSSVEARVKQWESYVGGQADIAAQERGAPPLGTAVMELHGRLERDRREITELIRKTYGESTPIDTLAVGPMRTAIQNKVVFYDN
ncbi:1-phosphatidylinositol-3-phosphate 5-kinase, partial [Tulasnella sp. 427]